MWHEAMKTIFRVRGEGHLDNKVICETVLMWTKTTKVLH